MTSFEPDRARAGELRRSRPMLMAVGVMVVALAVALVVVAGCSGPSSSSPLPVRAAGEVGLPGDSSRFDYASLDADRGLLFVAHLGASEVIEVDVWAHRVVRTIPDLPQVHGVLVVPGLRRVYATATGANRVVSLDEDTGAVLHRAVTGEYPDGLAFDPHRGAVWTTNESGGSETVIDAATGAVRGTVALGAEVGNVVYDPAGDRMLVAVQGRNELAVIDPATLAVIRRVPLPGCEHDHGLALDPDSGVAFVACAANAALLTVDLTGWQVLGMNPVGDSPDVLAYDPGAHRLYVAAESGPLTVLDLGRDRRLGVAGSDHLADGAHVVVVDPGTHHSYYPIPSGANGRPALLDEVPVR
ncbi:MAG: YncE family protein [Pseudonocardiaceae bacterium]